MHPRIFSLSSGPADLPVEPGNAKLKSGSHPLRHVHVKRASRLEHPAITSLDEAVLGDARRSDELRGAIDHGHCYVAVDSSGVVGYMVFNQGFFGRCFVWLVAVHPDARRGGVGTALMRHAERLCTTDKLFTSTNQSNVAMRKLCTSLGYVRSGVIENLDNDDPELVFMKRLRAT